MKQTHLNLINLKTFVFLCSCLLVANLFVVKLKFSQKKLFPWERLMLQHLEDNIFVIPRNYPFLKRKMVSLRFP